MSEQRSRKITDQAEILRIYEDYLKLADAQGRTPLSGTLSAAEYRRRQQETS